MLIVFGLSDFHREIYTHTHTKPVPAARRHCSMQFTVNFPRKVLSYKEGEKVKNGKKRQMRRWLWVSLSKWKKQKMLKLNYKNLFFPSEINNLKWRFESNKPYLYNGQMGVHWAPWAASVNRSQMSIEHLHIWFLCSVSLPEYHLITEDAGQWKRVSVTLCLSSTGQQHKHNVEASPQQLWFPSGVQNYHSLFLWTSLSSTHLPALPPTALSPRYLTVWPRSCPTFLPGWLRLSYFSEPHLCRLSVTGSQKPHAQIFLPLV